MGNYGKPDTWGQSLARKRRLEAFESNKTRFITNVKTSTKERTHNTLGTEDIDSILNNASDYEGENEKETIENLLQLEYFSLLKENIPFNSSSDNIDDKLDRFLGYLGDILVKIYRKGRNYRNGNTLLNIKSAAKDIIGISESKFYNHYLANKQS